MRGTWGSPVSERTHSGLLRVRAVPGPPNARDLGHPRSVKELGIVSTEPVIGTRRASRRRSSRFAGASAGVSGIRCAGVHCRRVDFVHEQRTSRMRRLLLFTRSAYCYSVEYSTAQGCGPRAPNAIGSIAGQAD